MVKHEEMATANAGPMPMMFVPREDEETILQCPAE